MFVSKKQITERMFFLNIGMKKEIEKVVSYKLDSLLTF